jgi:hypothetical protein
MPETKTATQTTNTATKEIARKEVTALKDIGQMATKQLLAQVVSFASEIDKTPLTQEETIYASEIIQKTLSSVKERGINLMQIDAERSCLPQQIKRFARLKLSAAEKEIYPDIRKAYEVTVKQNGKDVIMPMYTIAISKQYQGVQKELVRHYKNGNKIDNFKQGVVCVGDEFVTEEDFATGHDRIIRHIKNPKLLDADRNKLENIEKAYAIAYEITPSGLTPITSIIDKRRITRAYNASKAKEK